MRNDDVFVPIGTFFLVMALLVAFYVSGHWRATDRMRAEAVKHGKAEYFINTNSLQREWRWKP
jgi:hypothetical protein